MMYQFRAMTASVNQQWKQISFSLGNLDPLKIARQQGYRAGKLQASTTGESVYRKMGIVECGEITPYQWRV